MRGLLVVMVLWAGCGGARRGDGGETSDLARPIADLSSPPDLAPRPPSDLTPPPQCISGRYVGTYEGSVLIGGLVPTATKGSVDLTLAQTGGEFFEIMNGKLMGTASGNPYSADLVGTLNCTTLKLDMGFLKNGTVRVGGLDYQWEGPLTADYDPKSVSFVNGKWDIKQVNGPSTGKGTWTARHM